jgi:hypothetical protein
MSLDPRQLRPRRRLRVATRRFRILPSFLIIGAQRAGTTSLFDYLRRHPEVAGPAGGERFVVRRKEVHFFDDRFAMGIDWYRSFFPLAARQRHARRRGRDLVAGEATPYYMFHPAVPERVASTLPDVKLIALLRDPVDRAYSHYQLVCRKGWEQLSFEEAVEAEERRLEGQEERLEADLRGWHHRRRAYLSRGLYAEQLERWLAHFPREQLLVVRSEDLRHRSAEVYAEVLAFLGLRPWEPPEYVTRNRAAYPPLDPDLRARLAERFVEPNERLAELLGRDFGWSRGTTAAEPASRHVEVSEPS